mmetsp:Transcript_6318/g.13933  ORF Transcript_6318/g.13933 Transcript_6318/m.13933 type:complete len:770 (-) Transcript_6318:1632-3941(-)|eukprot:CAMPEP_0202901476 /NCGR_PEP_ID=MMETSP1392-20130828/14272_1 /ASSEMBLY_ACC=CAM_ASM_000868 /TAXON_ID=225041 /ORGANISM="Chlamydomonas chlamydogama, Strain SAG 11-48b" /LENGTH=769 /DNA_ID=CAMNT_0049588037 /DNA_START=131 /DNA_END=2440 /DNA_ORIENTATION=-
MSLLTQDLQAFTVPGLSGTFVPTTIQGQALFPGETQYVQQPQQQALYFNGHKLVPMPTMKVRTLQAANVPGAGQPVAYIDATGMHLFPGQNLQAQTVQVRGAGVAHKPQQVQQLRPVQTFISAAPSQQFVQLQCGGGGSISDVHRTGATNIVGLTPSQHSSSITSAAAAAALATTNHVTQSHPSPAAGTRALLPVQTMNGLAANSGAVRAQTITLPPGAVAVRPSQHAASLRQGQVFAGAAAAAAAPQTLVRPVMRAPKVATVSTYNPVTGIHSATVTNSAQNVLNNVLAPQNTGVQYNLLPNGTLQRVVQIQPSAAQANNSAVQQQLLADLQARVNAIASANREKQAYLAAGADGRAAPQIVNITLPSGMPSQNAATQAVVDQNGSLLARLLASQAQAPSGKGQGGGKGRQPGLTLPFMKTRGGDEILHKGTVLPSQHVLQAAQTALNLMHEPGALAIKPQKLAPSEPKTDAAAAAAAGLSSWLHASGNMDAGNSQRAGQSITGTLQSGTMPTAPMLSKSLSDPSVIEGALMTMSSSSDANTVSRKAHAAVHDTSAAKMDSKAAVDQPLINNKEDFKLILACIGVELARHGISIEAAVTAGWLGVLSSEDVAVLADAYAQEEQRLLETGSAHSSKAAQLEEDDDMNAAAFGQLLQAPEELDKNQFSAAHFGFFGDLNANSDLLEPLEGMPAVPAAPSWGSANEDVVQELSTMNGPNIERQSNDGVNFDASKVEGRMAAPGGWDAQPNPGNRDTLAARFANLDLGIGFY